MAVRLQQGPGYPGMWIATRAAVAMTGWEATRLPGLRGRVRPEHSASGAFSDWVARPVLPEEVAQELGELSRVAAVPVLGELSRVAAVLALGDRR